MGGTPVPDGKCGEYNCASKYTFMVEFISNVPGGPRDCVGTLIDRDSVLTAAHCVKGAKLVTMFVGMADPAKTTNYDFSWTGQSSKIFIHPRFKSIGNSEYYDAAVIKWVEKPLPRGIKPIGLATAEQDKLETPGYKLTVAGWGSTKEGGMPTDRMREVSVPVVSDSAARRVYASRTIKYLPSQMVAAGATGKDACKGDSGGPLFDPATSTQVGIVSFGIGCGRRGFPTAYTEANNPAIRTFILDAARR